NLEAGRTAGTTQAAAYPARPRRMATPSSATAVIHHNQTQVAGTAPVLRTPRADGPDESEHRRLAQDPFSLCHDIPTRGCVFSARSIAGASERINVVSGSRPKNVGARETAVPSQIDRVRSRGRIRRHSRERPTVVRGQSHAYWPGLAQHFDRDDHS